MGPSIVSQQKPTDFVTKILNSRGCDTPETGGISGTLNRKPSPVVLEDRPKTIDPKTGKLVYLDTLRSPGVIYLLG